jgi:[NiFe] hydrogenase assembly HybE family chaperone
MSEECVVRGDPSEELARVFRAAAARMAGFAFVNPALRVEAVGFAPWEGAWLGVIVTPWCMNLVLAPRDPALWLALARGAKRTYHFPSGDYEFVGALDEAVGDYQVCSLLSPLLEYDDHETARLVASLAREALFDPTHADPSAAATGRRAGPLMQLEANLAAPMSKRAFLHGRFLRGDHDDRG